MTTQTYVDDFVVAALEVYDPATVIRIRLLVQ